MKTEYFIKDINQIVESSIGALIIIIMLLLYTRIFGLKSFSKMTGYDFIITIMIGNIAAMSLCTGKPGLVVGIILLGLMYAYNYIMTQLRYRNEAIEKISSNKPILLMRDGNIIHENMKKSKVTENELRGKLREANVLRLSQAKAVILETTGDVSVLHADGDESIDGFLLEDVIS